jgi:hypothetical protein
VHADEKHPKRETGCGQPGSTVHQPFGALKPVVAPHPTHVEDRLKRDPGSKDFQRAKWTSEHRNPVKRDSGITENPPLFGMTEDQGSGLPHGSTFSAREIFPIILEKVVDANHASGKIGRPRRLPRPHENPGVCGLRAIGDDDTNVVSLKCL